MKHHEMEMKRFLLIIHVGFVRLPFREAENDTILKLSR